jgi:hypothetical protein
MSTTLDETTIISEGNAEEDVVPMHHWPLRAVMLGAMSHRRPRPFVTHPAQVPLPLGNYVDAHSEEISDARAGRKQQAETHLMKYADVLADVLQRLDRIPESNPLAQAMTSGLATELAYCRAAILLQERTESPAAPRIHTEFLKRLGSRYPQTFEDENGVIEDFLSVPPNSGRPEVGRFTETMSYETRRINGERFSDLSETSFNPIGGFESYDHLTPSLYELEAMRDMLNGIQSTSSTH